MEQTGEEDRDRDTWSQGNSERGEVGDKSPLASLGVEVALKGSSAHEDH